MPLLFANPKDRTAAHFTTALYYWFKLSILHKYVGLFVPFRYFVFSLGVFSLFRFFAWRLFVISSFRMAFFRLFVFSLGVLAGRKDEITPGEKTK